MNKPYHKKTWLERNQWWLLFWIIVAASTAINIYLGVTNGS